MDVHDIEVVMSNFHQKIGQERLRWLMEEFSGDKSIKALFKLLWDQEEAHQCLSPNLAKCEKSNEEAERLRTEGNKFYKQKNLDKALELYNLSIMKAIHPGYTKSSSCTLKKRKENIKEGGVVSEGGSSQDVDVQENQFSSLALGYANRSAVLLEMHLYDKCMEDICLALSHGYPQSSLSKLEERKQKCLAAKKNNGKFKETLLPQSCKSAKEIILSSYGHPKLPELSEPNPVLPSYSSSVKVSYTSDKGRHIVATKDIRPGEIIGIEKRYCSSLDQENMTTHCSNCLTSVLTPLPCPSCSLVVFCSDVCRQEGVFGKHWLECPILPTLNILGLKPTFSMVYKLLKFTSHIKWKTALEGLQEQESQCSEEELGLNERGIYSPVDYESIYHLVTNKEKRPNGDLYVKCLLAFTLMELLKKSDRYFLDFFGKPFTPGMEDLVMTGETLFSNLMKISCNGFQLVEFQCDGPPFALQRKTVGSAIFPTLSLINHSCDPSATPYIYGPVQVLRAIRCISIGDEVTGNYCNNFYSEGQEERQMGLLEVYQFTCNCEACQKNWPTYGNLPKEMQFRCVDCLRPVSPSLPLCQNCKFDHKGKESNVPKQLLIDEWWATVSQVKEAYDRSQHLALKLKSSQPPTDEDFFTIRDAVELMDKHVLCPCQPLWDAFDAMDLYFRLNGAPIYRYLLDYGG